MAHETVAKGRATIIFYLARNFAFEKFREGFLKTLVQLDLASPSGLESSEK